MRCEEVLVEDGESSVEVEAQAVEEEPLAEYLARLDEFTGLAIGKTMEWQTRETGLLCSCSGIITEIVTYENHVACEWRMQNIKVVRRMADGVKPQPAPHQASLLCRERIDLPDDLAELGVLKLPVDSPTLAAEVTFSASS